MVETEGAAVVADAAEAQGEAGVAISKGSKLALWAMLLGVGGMFLSFVVVGIPIAFLAVVLGLMARGAIQKSGGKLIGKGMMTVGILAGLIGCVIVPVVLVFTVVPAFEAMRVKAQDMVVMDQGRELGLAVHVYHEDKGAWPGTIGDLAESGVNEATFYMPQSGRSIRADFAQMTFEDKRELIRVQSDFVFVPIVEGGNASERVVMFSNPLVRDSQFMVVVFLDGHAEMFEGDWVKEMLGEIEKQNDGKAWMTLLHQQRSNQ
ncbi:hypothetical protein KS4_03450 [Poriferisphaera corsica]|uniref:DUF4190 domain-containing protein n=1 Tax=Poriferisphaera corsica TaxID=2528020 RepID=A0A517YQ14_9BACT|nr:DUF4190 domain-containing protein [Poriferisphaera corsica]QDU32313.1 hypothetical protein KS4_03450 [Poriferisphaera corsica]